jgi:hypothetical protein
LHCSQAHRAAADDPVQRVLEPAFARSLGCSSALAGNRLAIAFEPRSLG